MCMQYSIHIHLVLPKHCNSCKQSLIHKGDLKKKSEWWLFSQGCRVWAIPNLKRSSWSIVQRSKSEAHRHARLLVRPWDICSYLSLPSRSKFLHNLCIPSYFQACWSFLSQWIFANAEAVFISKHPWLLRRKQLQNRNSMELFGSHLWPSALVDMDVDIDSNVDIHILYLWVLYDHVVCATLNYVYIRCIHISFHIATWWPLRGSKFIHKSPWF